MLKLRRGVVVGLDPLTVEVAGEQRRAFADRALVGEIELGDEVIVNVEGLDLELGSGGFDVVHVNLTRGLEGGGAAGDAHVMKLNYTSLQHPVETVEVGEAKPGAQLARRPPTLVLALHGQLAPAAWAFAAARPGSRLGYVQTAGGALPGSLSRTVGELLERDLLAGHVTAGPAYGGRQEAITTLGALHAAAEQLGWDAIVAGPGPGILGSATAYGHGGMAALDTAHAALALGLPALLAPRLSAGDPRPRHRGLSHHTASVLELLLAPVQVAAPSGYDEAISSLASLCEGRHQLTTHDVDLEGYQTSGLPTTTMGRTLSEDPIFFAAALAAGKALALANP